MKLSQAVILSEREPKGFERVEGSPEFSGEFIVRITLWLRGLGMMYPTHTFSGTKTLVFGDLEVELLEAPGETHDHIIVWIPEDETLIAGDNFYWAFPNLYTLVR